MTERQTILPGTGFEFESGAEISPCGRYRYRLWRIWDRNLPQILWVMLNPSTADAEVDDPTIRRCIDFAKRWGFGGIQVVNIFAWRATDPRELDDAAGAGEDLQGPGYRDGLERALRASDEAILAWGASGGPFPEALLARIVEIEKLIPVWCLGRTKDGHPKHPLYIRGDQPRVRFDWKARP